MAVTLAAGAMIGSFVGLTVVAGIGVNVASAPAGWGLTGSIDSALARNGVLNHDLQAALLRGFHNADHQVGWPHCGSIVTSRRSEVVYYGFSLTDGTPIEDRIRRCAPAG